MTDDWREHLARGARVMCRLGPETGDLAFGAVVDLLIWTIGGQDGQIPPRSVRLKAVVVTAPSPVGTLALRPEEVVCAIEQDHRASSRDAWLGWDEKEMQKELAAWPAASEKKEER